MIVTRKSATKSLSVPERNYSVAFILAKVHELVQAVLYSRTWKPSARSQEFLLELSDVSSR
jgi:hypothetical protein